MRGTVLGVVVVVVAVGCSSPAPMPPAAPMPKPPGPVAPKPPVAPPRPDVWALAPPGTDTSIVVTMHGYERVGAAIRGLGGFNPMAKTMFAMMRIDRGFLLQPGQVPADIGLDPDGEIADDSGPWGGIIVLWPVVDRAKFVAAAGATSDGDVDHWDTSTCRMVHGIYACAEDAALLDQVGTGPGVTRVSLDGVRNDVVAVSTAPLLPAIARLVEATGPLVIAAQLDDGTAIIDARIPGHLRGALAALASAPRQKLDISGTSGAVVAALPELPGASNPLVAMLASFSGLRAVVPVGGDDYEIAIDLRDRVAAVRVVTGCRKFGVAWAVNPRAHPDECDFAAPGALDGVAWVDGNLMHVASARGGPLPRQVFLPHTAMTKRIGATPWTMAAWMRGSSLRPGPRLTTALGNAGANARFAMRLLQEVGLGIAVAPDEISAELVVRSVYADDPAVTDAYLALGEKLDLGDPIDADLAALVSDHPESPLAHDVVAGGGGEAVALWLTGYIAGLLAAAADSSAP